MSKLLNFSSGGNVGPAGGLRMASVILTPAAAVATLSLADQTGVILTLQAAANGASVEWVSGDTENGGRGDGQVVATLVGVGATYSVEEF